MNQKAKGPDEAATSIQAVSYQIPAKDKKMNKTNDSTGPKIVPAPGKPTDAVVAAAMRELENAIRELMHMADITAEAYDTMFSPSTRVGGNDGQSLTYRITKHEDDQLAFLVNNVATRCSNLHRSFEAAWKGEVLA